MNKQLFLIFSNINTYEEILYFIGHMLKLNNGTLL